MARIEGRHGLLWVGETYYKTAADFAQEASEMGVSRRIHAVPRGFEVGKHWVLLAHRKAIAKLVPDRFLTAGKTTFIPGIFQAFQPTAIEYVVTGTEDELEIMAMEKRGITPVKVIVDYPLAPAPIE